MNVMVGKIFSWHYIPQTNRSYEEATGVVRTLWENNGKQEDSGSTTGNVWTILLTLEKTKT